MPVQTLLRYRLKGEIQFDAELSKSKEVQPINLLNREVIGRVPAAFVSAFQFDLCQTS